MTINPGYATKVYGMSEAEVAREWAHVYERMDRVPMVLISMLSDVQEMNDRGQREQVRQAINRIKSHIDRHVVQCPKAHLETISDMIVNAGTNSRWCEPGKYDPVAVGFDETGLPGARRK